MPNDTTARSLASLQIQQSKISGPSSTGASEPGPARNNEEDLLKVIEEGWKLLEPSLLPRLANSMPHRCQLVIARKGAAIKY